MSLSSAITSAATETGSPNSAEIEPGRLFTGMNSGLTSFPTEILDLSNLTYLYLYDNQLMEIPTELGNLSNLRHLDLRHNQLAEIPPELENLSNLTTIDLKL
ncbi:MAG TPA: hypothetical protein EYQ50_21310 [Verrucomicrobiales bacterium]|nr:hypothetical protein [Verrucomicrobiales bacterium]